MYVWIIATKGCGRNSLSRDWTQKKDIEKYKVDKFTYFIVSLHLTMHKDNNC